MRILKLIIISLLMVLPTGEVAAQSKAHVKTVRKYLREGNKHFRNGHREDAYTAYKKAHDLDSINPRINYNFATSMLPQDYWRPWPKTDDSIMVKEVAIIDSLYRSAADAETNVDLQSMSFYNIGVMHQSLAQSKGDDEQQSRLKKAIEAYKEALRRNPSDNDARYNLVVCMKQLRKGQQQNQDQQDQNKDDNKDQNKEQNDSTQQQQNKPQQQQQPPQQQQPQEQQPQNMEQQKMDQMLRNAMQKEKEVQQRMNEANKEGMPARRPNRKNW